MRLIRFEHEGGAVVGVRVDGGCVLTRFTDVVELATAGPAGLQEARDAVAAGHLFTPGPLLAPLAKPGKMLFCGVNYAEHAEENPDAVLPKEPYFFSKLSSAIVGPDAPVVVPNAEAHVDYEVELAAIIGTQARDVSREKALDYVLGYTVVNDVSDRAVQFRDIQVTLGKNPDTFCPMGPDVLTVDEAPAPRGFHLTTRVNGEVLQSSSTASWLFDLEELISFVSQTITLEPGDVITTGTPAGVAAFRSPPPWLTAGDEMTVEIAEIGALSNPVVAKS